MMKLIFAGFGSLGDIIPMLCLAKAAKSYGYDVEFITYTYFKDKVEFEGIKCVPVGDFSDYQKMVSCTTGLSSSAYAYHHWEICAKFATIEMYNYLADSYQNQQGKVVILSLDICYGAIWCSLDFGIPLVSVQLAPFVATAEAESADASFLRLSISSTMNQLRRVAVTDVIVPPKTTLCLYSKAMLSQHALLNSSPDTYYLGFVDKSILTYQDVACSSPYDIVYTSGSAFLSTAEELSVFDSVCREINLRGLFISNNRDFINVPHLSIDITRSINIQSALSGNSIIIHHGGIGTISDAISKLAPQIVIPRAFDQFANGEWIQKSGMGLVRDCSILKSSNELIDAIHLIGSDISIFHKSLESFLNKNPSNIAVEDCFRVITEGAVLCV